MREQESLAPGSLVSKRTFAEIQKQAIISNTFCLKKILLLILFEAGWDCEQNFFLHNSKVDYARPAKKDSLSKFPSIGYDSIKDQHYRKS